MAHLIIHLRPSGSSLFSSSEANFSLLNALEKNYVPISFQCRSGYCGVCRVYLLEGKVKYYQEPIAFVGRGEILPCCCLPVSNIKLRLEL